MRSQSAGGGGSGSIRARRNTLTFKKENSASQAFQRNEAFLARLGFGIENENLMEIHFSLFCSLLKFQCAFFVFDSKSVDKMEKLTTSMRGLGHSEAALRGQDSL